MGQYWEIVSGSGVKEYAQGWRERMAASGGYVIQNSGYIFNGYNQMNGDLYTRCSAIFQ